MKPGILYLIPTTLGDAEISHCLPAGILSVIESCGEFIVENERSARRFIKKAGSEKNLDELILHPLNKHTDETDLSSYLNSIKKGINIGIISEAGCPAVADPGSQVVKMAHGQGIEVIPLVGPSSILLSLMASGFNGQTFTFHGYLPKEDGLRVKKIKQLESLARTNQTQLFIETPFRNQKLLGELLDHCAANTLLCIATDITLPSEFIRTKTIAEWRKKIPEINKRPTVFLLGS